MDNQAGMQQDPAQQDPAQQDAAQQAQQRACTALIEQRVQYIKEIETNIDKLNPSWTTMWFVEFLNNFASFMVLVVVLGCELDLFGFCLAFPFYWALGNFVRAFLIVMIVGYFGAVVTYKCLSRPPSRDAGQPDPEDLFPLDDVQELNPWQQQGADRTPFTNVTELLQLLRQRVAIKHIEMRLYHFIPIYRYYLLIKERDADDIEALYRVNSLSSFTLGIAQIIGILLYASRNQLNLFIYINVASQIVNWCITISYFMTDIVEWMQKAQDNDNDRRRYKATIRKWYVAYKKTKPLACLGAAESIQKCALLKKSLEGLINGTAETTFHLTDIPFKDLVRIAHKLGRGDACESFQV